MVFTGRKNPENVVMAVLGSYSYWENALKRIPFVRHYKTLHVDT